MRRESQDPGVHLLSGESFHLGESHPLHRKRNRAWLLWPMANFELRSPTVGVNIRKQNAAAEYLGLL